MAASVFFAVPPQAVSVGAIADRAAPSTDPAIVHQRTQPRREAIGGPTLVPPSGPEGVPEKTLATDPLEPPTFVADVSPTALLQTLPIAAQEYHPPYPVTAPYTPPARAPSLPAPHVDLGPPPRVF